MVLEGKMAEQGQGGPKRQEPAGSTEPGWAGPKTTERQKPAGSDLGKPVAPEQKMTERGWADPKLTELGWAGPKTTDSKMGRSSRGPGVPTALGWATAAPILGKPADSGPQRLAQQLGEPTALDLGTAALPFGKLMTEIPHEVEKKCSEKRNLWLASRAARIADGAAPWQLNPETLGGQVGLAQTGWKSEPGTKNRL